MCGETDCIMTMQLDSTLQSLYMGFKMFNILSYDLNLHSLADVNKH